MATTGRIDFFVLTIAGFLCMVPVVQVSDAASLSDLENRLVDLESQGRKQDFLLSQQEKEIQQVRHELKLSKEQAENYKEQLDEVVNTIKHHETVINTQNTQLAEQQTHIEVTSKELTWYKTRVEKLNSRIQDLEYAVNQQSKDILEEEDSDMAQHTGNLDRVDENESEIMQNTGKQENKTNNIQLRNFSVPGVQLKKKQRRFVMAGAERPVTFYATSDKGNVEHIGIGQKLVLDQVIINHGKGYHNQQGVFIAPVNGVYTFSASVMTSNLPEHREIRAGIVKNGVALGAAFGHADGGRHDQGAVTVITELKQGDEVWIRNFDIADNAYYGARYTTFCGYLMY